MARIRTIKPEFWTDDDLVTISRDARLFFIGLWNFADDNGVLEYGKINLKIKIFPADDIDVRQLVEELKKIDKIHVYSNNGKDYIYIKNLNKHQVIDRPRKSSLPMPGNIEINGNQLKSTEISLGREGKGMEGKGMEGAESPRHQTEEIISDFNEVIRPYRPYSVKTIGAAAVELIHARLKDGFTVDDFKYVHRVKNEEWAGDEKMDQYLRPSTLYRKSKFPEYRAQKMKKQQKKDDNYAIRAAQESIRRAEQDTQAVSQADSVSQ